MDEKLIKKYFDADIYSRGYKYFRTGKVSNMVLSGAFISAMVEGSDDNKYIVKITLNEDKNIIKRITCSCPCNFNCKHAAAVLIFYSYTGASKASIDVLKNPLTENADFHEMIKTIEFDKLNVFPKQNELFKKFYKTNDKKPLSMKNYRALIAIGFDQPLNSFTPVKWFVYPAVQMIKRDGSFGKIELLKKEKPDVDTGEDIKEIFNSLCDGYGFKYKFEKYIDYMINKRIPFYYTVDKEPLPFSIEKISFIEISFNLQHMFAGELVFKPKLHLITADKKEYIFDDKNILDSDNFLSFILLFNRMLLFFDKSKINQGLCELLFTFMNKNTELNLADINIFREMILKYDGEKFIKANFDYKKAEVKKIIPKVIVEIEENKGLLDIKVLFDYEGNILYYSNNINDYIIDMRKDQGTIYVYDRNHVFEKNIIKYLKAKFTNSVYKIVDSYFEHKYFVMVLEISLRDFLVSYAIPLLDEGYQFKYAKNKEKISRNRGRLKLSIKSEIDWFDVKGKIYDENGDEAEFTFAKEDVQKGLIKVNNNFVILSKEDIIKLGKFIDAGMDEKGNLSVNKLHFNTIDSLYKEFSEKDKESEKIFDIIEKLKDFKKIIVRKVPIGFNGKLRDYQKDGYDWLYFLYEYNLNGCLADDMGLGKTVQTLCFLQSLKDQGKLGKVLLLVPVSTISNWEDEIARFTPGLKSTRHFGAERKRENEVFSGIDIIITSYHTFRNDVEFFKDLKINYFILDEAQNIKNALSLTFKAVKFLSADHKLTLTGTPVENNTLELWAQMDFLNPGLLGTIKDFKKDFANNIEKYGDRDAAKKLKQFVQPFILRRKKEDVAKDLPDKEEIVYHCEMQDAQRNFYEKIKSFHFDKVSGEIEKNGIEKSAMVFFEGLLRLRQAVLYPGIIDVKNESIDSCKNEALFDIIDDIIFEDHKILIFSQFVETLKRIEKVLKRKEYLYAYLDGSTKNREKEIKNFQENEKVKIFLISLKAGGVGINLTSADYVILFDPWWNPAVERQAVDRAHRIGQKKKVIVYKLIVKDSIEEKILLLQDRKKALVSDIISEDAGFFKSLTKEDMLGLFK